MHVPPTAITPRHGVDIRVLSRWSRTASILVTHHGYCAAARPVAPNGETLQPLLWPSMVGVRALYVHAVCTHFSPPSLVREARGGTRARWRWHLVACSWSDVEMQRTLNGRTLSTLNSSVFAGCPFQVES